MEKLKGKSKDIVEQNIEQLKEIFPEVFSEGKINFNQLQELLGSYVTENEDHYNFTWHGKRKAGRLAQTPSTGTLRPAKDESVDWDTTQNLFIEGDNLEVLKLLQKSYHRKVKMIYIDPPYNTGNDFVYKDDYKDGIKNYLDMTGQLDNEGKKLGTNSSAAGRYHTNWLNMMYPRLKLARNLLRDDGVIFISIGDSEEPNLKKICDEVFGELNFIEIFIIRSNPRGNQAKKLTASEHEYIICYAKTIDKIKQLGFIKSVEDYDKQDDRGIFREIGLRKRGADSRREDAPNQYFPIFYNPDNRDLTTTPELSFSMEILPKLSNGKSGRWRWSKRTVEVKKDSLLVRLVRRKSGCTEYDVFEKDYFSEDKKSKIKSIVYDKFANYENASDTIRDLFDGIKVFDYPKPEGLLAYFIKSIVTEGVILDFFAGSGSTAHGVMALNLEDAKNGKAGKRHCISVQLPEVTDKKSEAFKAGYTNIAEICKERIRRAGKKIKGENPSYNGDLGFKVFKLDSSSIKRWDADFDSLESHLLHAVDYIKQDRSSEDILYELLLKYGLDLTLPIESRSIAGKEVYSIGLGALVVCLENDISMDVANGIAELKEELKPEIMRVVFKDEGFKDDVIKTNILQMLWQHGIEDVKSL